MSEKELKEINESSAQWKIISDWWNGLLPSQIIEYKLRYLGDHKPYEFLTIGEITLVWEKEVRDKQIPYYKQLHEQITKGEWKAKQSRGNNRFQHKITVPNIKTICEMEADGEHDLPQVVANAKYTALSVNNLHILAEALQIAINKMDQARGILSHSGNWGMLETTKLKEALNNISKQKTQQ